MVRVRPLRRVLRTWNRCTVGSATDGCENLVKCYFPESRFGKVVRRIRLLVWVSDAMGKVSFCKSLKIRMLVSDSHGAKTSDAMASGRHASEELRGVLQTS